MRTQPEAWGAAVRGQTLVECLLSIPTLAILPTLALLLSLRQDACLAPVPSGALAGLGSGAAATAAFLSLYRTTDDPLFFVTWYGAAILATKAMDAVLGQRLLRR